MTAGLSNLAARVVANPSSVRWRVRAGGCGLSFGMTDAVVTNTSALPLYSPMCGPEEFPVIHAKEKVAGSSPARRPSGSGSSVGRASNPGLHNTPALFLTEEAFREQLSTRGRWPRSAV